MLVHFPKNRLSLLVPNITILFLKIVTKFPKIWLWKTIFYENTEKKICEELYFMKIQKKDWNNWLLNKTVTKQKTNVFTYSILLLLIKYDDLIWLKKKNVKLIKNWWFVANQELISKILFSLKKNYIKSKMM